jgi:hypothetical protein
VYLVVVLLPVAVALFVSHYDPLDPLDVPRAHDPRDNDAQRETVIPRERLPVHLISQNDIATRIYGTAKRDGGAVGRSVGAVVTTLKLNVLCHYSAIVVRDAGCF